MNVTGIIRTIEQPWGGYLPISRFEHTQFAEETHEPTSGTVGEAADYLSRYIYGDVTLRDAFAIPLTGAALVGDSDNAEQLLSAVKGTDAKSLRAALKLVCYDSCLRAGASLQMARNSIEARDHFARSECKLLHQILDNEKVFYATFGRITRSRLTFPGGYSATIDSGDGDLCTKDTLWDLKCSRHKPKKEDTLQILVYYIMAINSDDAVNYADIQYLGIMNPVMGLYYRIKISEIPNETFYAVCKDVIRYRMREPASTDWMSDIIDKFNVDAARGDDYLDNQFDPFELPVGTHHITEDDYYCYWRRTFRDAPKLVLIRKYCRSILLIRSEHYVMYLGEGTKDGVYYILSGGAIRRSRYDVAYYERNLEDYGQYISARFGEYFSVVCSIRDQLTAAIAPYNQAVEMYYREQAAAREGTSVENAQLTVQDILGIALLSHTVKQHGGIIDINFNNHIFVNLVTGRVDYYIANDQSSRAQYESFPDLIAAADLQKIAKKLLLNTSISELRLSGTINETALIEMDDEEDVKIRASLDESSGMYAVNRILIKAERTVEHHLVTEWLNVMKALEG